MIPQTNPNSWRAPESIAVGVAGAVVAGVIFLLGEPVSSDQAVDAAAVVTRVWRSSVADRNMVSYRFTAEHRNWSGEASAPLGIWTKLRSGAPLRIRYAPGWPSLNHPVGWPSPRSFDWPLPLRLEPDTREALQRWAD